MKQATPPTRATLALAGCLMLGIGGAHADETCATLPAFSVPPTVAQGGLVRARVPAGAVLSLLQGGDAGALAVRQVRVGPAGDFVIGAGRDEAGPLRIHLELVDGATCDFEVTVLPRPWKIERIEGVPQSTVTPRPEIAARIEREQAEVSRARERDDDRDDFAIGFTWPVKGRISGVYGSQRIYNGTPKSPHSGLDVAAPTGTPVLAPAAGIVSFARPDLYLTGGTVLLDHGHGLSSNFLHLSRLDVRVGQRVEQGQAIGLVGATGRATGPHMHWGMNWFGVRVDPQLLLDPVKVQSAASQASAAPSR
jgi:hypothetical protein